MPDPIYTNDLHPLACRCSLCMEPEKPRCSYCDACEVEEEGSYCSETCKALEAMEFAADQAMDAEREGLS